MAVYAIGDVQGCYDPLRLLLDKLRFDPDRDLLWFAGDLINRGPKSLKVLRFVHDLGDSAVTVLGNHDLTLLAVAEGFVKPRKKDTFKAILESSDRESLLQWLRYRPMLHYDPDLGYLMVHAGIAPQWDLQTALACAEELEMVLRGADYRNFLAHMFGSEPRQWRDDLRGFDRLRFIVNCLTRIRFCTADGVMDFSHKGAPGSQPEGLVPWFEAPGRRIDGVNIVCGHWASLGYYRAPGLYALDSGCVWGNCLTALRLDGPNEVFSVDCAKMKKK